MEGPSLYLAKKQLKPFNKKRVLAVAGNTKIEKERFLNKEVKEIFSWGKHLLFQFNDCALKVHFLLWGTFKATVNGKSVTGDYEKKSQTPRLAFEFENGTIEMYNCSVKIIEDTKIKKSYDFSVDIMSPSFDPDKAYQNVISEKEEDIADVLLDQDIFAGVGNIIKNEILSLVYIQPEAKVRNLSPKKIREIIATAKSYSLQFLKWREKFLLLKNLKIHRKGTCVLQKGRLQ